LNQISEKKLLAHEYFGRRIFSKFFGGKIKNVDKGYHESKCQHGFAKTTLIFHKAE